MRSVKEADVTNKKVLVRAAFDVPVGENGIITDDTRIIEALPTLKYLLENNAKIILISHLGRPDGSLVAADSLLPVAQQLEMLLKRRITFIPEKLETKIQSIIQHMQEDEIILLENLRFHAGEEDNDPKFSAWLASMADVFVNDAFSDCHRAHASMVGIPKILPAYAGLALEKEVMTLTKLLEKPTHPVVAIIGGAKLDSKLPVVERFLAIADQILIGSKFVNEKFPASEKIILPVDVIKHPDGRVLDIGPKTVKLYCDYVKEARTVFWSGPLGLFEDSGYAAGTRAVGEAVAANKGQTVVGGGDTLSALKRFSLLDKIKYASTGGSAMLELISGKKLPGIEALK